MANKPLKHYVTSRKAVSSAPNGGIGCSNCPNHKRRIMAPFRCSRKVRMLHPQQFVANFTPAIYCYAANTHSDWLYAVQIAGLFTNWTEGNWSELP
jgi:hypothetical protein